MCTYFAAAKVKQAVRLIRSMGCSRLLRIPIIRGKILVDFRRYFEVKVETWGAQMRRIAWVGLIAAIMLTLALPVASEARGHVSFGIGIGIPAWGPWWGPGYWGPYSYPYYAPAPVVVQQAPPVMVQPQPEPSYWYYCQHPQGYYPYVQSCPNGWMKVVPPAGPPAQ